MPYTPVPVVTPVIIASHRCETQPSKPPSPTEVMAGKVIGFSFVALMALVVAALVASTIIEIRNEGWTWPALFWLCAAVLAAGMVVALGVLVAA